MREVVTVFYCDSCNKNDIKIIDTKPENEGNMFCPYCKSKMVAFHDYVAESNAKKLF